MQRRLQPQDQGRALLDQAISSRHRIRNSCVAGSSGSKVRQSWPSVRKASAKLQASSGSSLHRWRLAVAEAFGGLGVHGIGRILQERIGNEVKTPDPLPARAPMTNQNSQYCQHRP